MIPKAQLETTLEQLNELTSAALWEMVKEGLGFPAIENNRMKALIQKSKWEALSADESKELENLLELQGKYVLLRTNTLLELQARGEDVKTYLKENAPQVN